MSGHPNSIDTSFSSIRFASKAVVLFSPFTVWLSISPWLRLSHLVTIGALGFLVIWSLTRKRSPLFEWHPLVDIPILGFSSLTFINGIIHASDLSPKMINHIFVRSMVVMLFFWGWRVLFQTGQLTRKDLFKICAVAAFVLNAVIVADAICVNFLGYELRSLFIIADTGNTDYFRRLVWITPSSPAEEPATAAYFSAILWSLGVIHVKHAKLRIQAPLWGLHILATASLFSTAGAISLVITILPFASTISNKAKIIITSAFGIISIWLYQFISPFVAAVSNEMTSKLLMSNANLSASKRMATWTQATRDFVDAPLLGKGVGYGNTILETGYHGILWSIPAETGLIGFAVFSCIFAAIVWMTLKTSNDSRKHLIAAVLIMVFNNSIGDYYYQPLDWLIPALLCIKE